MDTPTSGTDLLDVLIDGVRIGDNLVLQGDAAAPLDLLVDRFVDRVTGRLPLVLVNIAAPWHGPVPAGTTVVDWSPALTGRPSDVDGALAPDASLEDALASLRLVDDRVGAGAAFVFDQLTAVQEAWSSDAALELFLNACPRLYRRRSLALWPIELERHRPTFLRRLAEITQVVVELTTTTTSATTDDDGRLHVAVRKADGRGPGVVGRSVHAEVVDGDLRAIGEAITTRERLGTVIRDQRLVRGLSQAELARRVEITPSALSQVERGVRNPSGDTLMRLWEVLGVPFGPPQSTEHGYRVSRRSGRDHPRLQDGLIAERLVADATTGEQWRLEMAPGASGDRPPFAVKAPEVATVVRGVLDLHLGGRLETLHEGDALLVTDAAITGWANPGSEPTEVIWTLHTGR